MGLDQQRPGARGGRAARRANKLELEADFQKARGVISIPESRGELAWAEAKNCPICRQRVHPTNWSDHMTLKHPDQTAPLHEAEPGWMPLAAIRIDGGTQPRAMTEEDVINDYADAMREGMQFPQVVIFYDGSAYWLADGFHRVEAAKRVGHTDIPADVRQGTQRDAILFSVGANADHGLRRTNADKRRAVMRLLTDEEWAKWPDRQIARQCEVTHPFVSKIRSELSGNGFQMPTERKVERGGTTYTQNTANIGKSSPPVQPYSNGHAAPQSSTPPVRYGQVEDDYQPDVPSVQVDENGEPAETWEEARLKPPDNGRYSENETEWKFGGRGATVRLKNSGMMGTLAFAVGRMVYVDTINGRRQYYDDNVEPVADQDAPQSPITPINLVERAQQLGADATIIEGVNYKRDSKTTRPATPDESQPYDRMQTPPYALDPLLPYLGWSLPSTIWEPACGEGLIVEALYDAGWKEEHVVSSDILTGENFFEHQPNKWEVIVTNPPYSLKIEWIERCYQLGKPFALLLPIDALGSGQIQALIQAHGFEIMLLDSRVDFKMPNKGWDSHAQFATFWLCHDLLPEKVMFGSIKSAKKTFKAEIGDVTDSEVDDD